MTCVVLVLLSCSKNRGEIQSFAFVKPEHFPNTTYDFSKNEITEEGFLLGRKLFYDPLLSLDGSVACANCHQQGTAFADGQQHPFSIGVDNEVGIRNAPMLTNLAFFKEFFWDGGVTHLDFVPINAIESEIEMKESLSNVVSKLNANAEYLLAFKKAFDVDSISSPYLLKALSQFTLMMVSASSPYDKWLNHSGELTQQEQEGLNLFQSKCATCHTGVLFTNHEYRNIGLDSIYPDKGRALISENPLDDGKFRVPSLRNVALTAPYMHNARFWSLKEVLDHYDTGVLEVENLAPELRNEPQIGIPLSEVEKEAIISFLKTLSDVDFIQDQKFVEYN
ncbi:cytochrome c peroxidase [Lishizhenia tianjinensis]|uniref:Cytochrome c peroxidase n=2 Tax=Lishizhenia tianjinensis TaxID=477690 RepID=A0A1I6XME3_9FLAO|nr:cytochrome c peroxidase [Lishizhenia tianjinensis]